MFIILDFTANPYEGCWIWIVLHITNEINAVSSHVAQMLQIPEDFL